MRQALGQDRIELICSGTLRRAADYRMEDAAGFVLGQISERITRKRGDGQARAGQAAVVRGDGRFGRDHRDFVF